MMMLLAVVVVVEVVEDGSKGKLSDDDVRGGGQWWMMRRRVTVEAHTLLKTMCVCVCFQNKTENDEKVRVSNVTAICFYSCTVSAAIGWLGDKCNDCFTDVRLINCK